MNWRARALAALLSAATALAAEDDYRVENPRWNGLSELASLARGKQLAVAAPTRLDLGAVDPARDAIAIFYPRGAAAAAAGDALARFVEAGGRLLVADDYGDGGAIFSRFGAERVPDPPIAPELHRENPALPLARAIAGHELAAGVSRVVLNHAAALRLGAGSKLVPVLAASLPVAAAGEIGGGRVVLCADPSLFINNMLERPGNYAFAQNLLDWLGRPGGRLFVLAQELALAGSVATPARPERAPELGRFFVDFNAFLGQIDGFVPLAGPMRAAGALASLGALAFLASAAARLRGRRGARGQG